MRQEDLKRLVAWEVLEYIKFDAIIGIGTGSTVMYFIEALSSIKEKIRGVVSSSYKSSILLKKLGIPLFNLNDLHTLDIYIDSADEINDYMQMIKGKGAALTQEKIIATASKKFICIVDSSKKVDFLGDNCPLPVEVIPMARSLVSRELIRLVGGFPKYRCGVITDNGNNILDIYNLQILDPLDIEEKIKSIPGVVDVGIFARRCADIMLVSTNSGIKHFFKTCIEK